MLKFMLSVRLPERLLPRIRVDESCSPALAPPNGTVFVSAANAPPLLEISKSADGILFPAPSVKAEVELEKNAYSFRLPTLGRSNHVVVAVTAVLPGLLALPCVNVKLTAFDESETVIESFSTAFKLM